MGAQDSPGFHEKWHIACLLKEFMDTPTLQPAYPTPRLQQGPQFISGSPCSSRPSLRLHTAQQQPRPLFFSPMRVSLWLWALPRESAKQIPSSESLGGFRVHLKARAPRDSSSFSVGLRLSLGVFGTYSLPQSLNMHHGPALSPLFQILTVSPRVLKGLRFFSRC